MGNAIISGVILGFCALLMIGIGVSQKKSKKPVGFYSGEEAPDEEKISDVAAWNKKHGMMWILYGVGIGLSWVCGLLLGDSILLLVPMAIFILLPIPLMIRRHKSLVRQYYKEET